MKRALRHFVLERQLGFPANVTRYSVPVGKHRKGERAVSGTFPPEDVEDPFEEMTSVASRICTNSMENHPQLCRHGDRYWALNEWSGFLEFGRFDTEETASSECADSSLVPSFDRVDWIDGGNIGECEPPDRVEWVDEDYGFKRVDAATPGDSRSSSSSTRGPAH